MRRKILGALLGAASLVAMAGPASAATNNQRFATSIRFGPTGTTSCRVVASGPVQGVGTCTTTDVSDNVTDLHFVFPNGTVDIRATSVSDTGGFNQTACVGKFSFKETFRVTGGTGVYAGVTGRGTDAGTGLFTGARTPEGGCDPSSGSGVVVANAFGHLTLGPARGTSGRKDSW